MHKPGLYIVSTPIGNLNDITFRAIETLKCSDIILCEDTRVSSKLMTKYHITTPLSVYNDKSNDSQRNYVIKNIESGNVVSLISDAGTPLISDPGYKLVKTLKDKGYFVETIPGPCSPIAALTLSGLPSNRFTFIGFLPKTLEAKSKIFKEFSDTNSTLIFFDSATRILSSLEVAILILGDRQANVSRELTKMFQESKTAKLSGLIEYYKINKPKGEIVLLISGTKENNVSNEKINEEIKNLLKSGLTAKDSTDKMFQKYHNYYTKAEIYKICNNFKKKT